MSMHLDTTYGAAFIGMNVAAVLYGIACVQALHYYTTQNDPWYTKHLVTTVMIFDTIHQALVSHSVYTYTITDWGDPAALGVIVWSLSIEVLFIGLTALIVQSFLTIRIWRLSRNIYLTGIPAISSLAGFVILVISIAKAFTLKSAADIVETKDYTIAINALGAGTDIVIAATLCTLLHNSRTGFQKSGVMISRLIVFTINTGLVTSICALGALISVVAASDTLIFVAFFFCLGRLYTNTLLATVNARQSMRNVDDVGNTTLTHQLRDFQRSVSSSQTQPLSIKIDTTTRKGHPDNDQTGTHEEKPGLSHDVERTMVSY